MFLVKKSPGSPKQSAQVTHRPPQVRGCFEEPMDLWEIRVARATPSCPTLDSFLIQMIYNRPDVTLLTCKSHQKSPEIPVWKQDKMFPPQLFSVSLTLSVGIARHTSVHKTKRFLIGELCLWNFLNLFVLAEDNMLLISCSQVRNRHLLCKSLVLKTWCRINCSFFFFELSDNMDLN